MVKRSWLAVPALLTVTALAGCGPQSATPLAGQTALQSPAVTAEATPSAQTTDPVITDAQGTHHTAAPAASRPAGSSHSTARAAAPYVPISRVDLSTVTGGNASSAHTSTVQGADAAQAGPVAPQGTETADATAPTATAEQLAAARAALAAHVTDRPFAGVTWDVERADLSGYDPAADLSWAVLSSADDATVRQVVLFHHQRPLQTTMAVPTAAAPEFARVDDGAVTITYWHEVDGRIDREGGALLKQTYTWNAATASATAHGEYWYDAAMEVFGFHALSGWVPSPAPVAGAAQGAGGLIPADSVALTADHPLDGVTLSATGTSQVRIDCAVNEGVQACLVPQDEKTTLEVSLGDAFGDQAPSAQLVAADERDEQDRTEKTTEAATVLTSGQTVHYGPYVFVGQPDGMTAWNSVTGHGFVLLGSTVTQF